MKNLCGKCTVCCTRHRIDKSEIFWKDGDKLAGETCEKLTDEQCSIYKDRPVTCRKYKCLWRQLVQTKEEYPELWRPDNINVLVDTYYYKDRDESVFAVKELKSGILNFSDLDPIIDGFLKSVFAMNNKQKGKHLIVLYPFGSDKGYKLNIDV